MLSLSANDHQFINEHLTDDVRTLLLRPPAAGLDLKKLAAQIAARQKARHKLPTWYTTPGLVFPPALSVEQASSEMAARYKASLVTGQLLVDLTGGMGVDTWAFADRVTQVLYVEQQTDLAELAAHNLPRLGAANVSVQSGNGLDLVAALPQTADWLYLDPHRRDEQGGRVVRLDQCEPNVLRAGLLTTLLTRTRQLLLKASPLIDIDLTVRQVGEAGHGVSAVHVVAVQGEVKEILFVLVPALVSGAFIEVNAVNLSDNKPVMFSFRKDNEQQATVALGNPEQFLYEPNAAVLKAGAFRLAGQRFGLTKLAPHTHLYTSRTLQADFPGRSFVVEHSIRPDRKALQAVIPARKANLTVRNFPQSVAELRKKLGLQEGGDLYLFATTLLNGDKRLLICRKADRGDT